MFLLFGASSYRFFVSLEGCVRLLASFCGFMREKNRPRGKSTEEPDLAAEAGVDTSFYPFVCVGDLKEGSASTFTLMLDQNKYVRVFQNHVSDYNRTSETRL